MHHQESSSQGDDRVLAHCPRQRAQQRGQQVHAAGEQRDLARAAAQGAAEDVAAGEAADRVACGGVGFWRVVQAHWGLARARAPARGSAGGGAIRVASRGLAAWPSARRAPLAPCTAGGVGGGPRGQGAGLIGRQAGIHAPVTSIAADSASTPCALTRPVRRCAASAGAAAAADSCCATAAAPSATGARSRRGTSALTTWGRRGGRGGGSEQQLTRAGTHRHARGRRRGGGGFPRAHHRARCLSPSPPPRAPHQRLQEGGVCVVVREGLLAPQHLFPGGGLPRGARRRRVRSRRSRRDAVRLRLRCSVRVVSQGVICPSRAHDPSRLQACVCPASRDTSGTARGTGRGRSRSCRQRLLTSDRPGVRARRCIDTMRVHSPPQRNSVPCGCSQFSTARDLPCMRLCARRRACGHKTRNVNCDSRAQVLTRLRPGSNRGRAIARRGAGAMRTADHAPGTHAWPPAQAATASAPR